MDPGWSPRSLRYPSNTIVDSSFNVARIYVAAAVAVAARIAEISPSDERGRGEMIIATSRYRRSWHARDGGMFRTMRTIDEWITHRARSIEREFVESASFKGSRTI